jgi:hypothetical protein
MAVRFDPRGDLPVPIIQNTSYYSRPDSTLSRYDHKRGGAYGLPPATYPKKKPCYDWIFSSASNVHVAVDRSAFKEYISFKSYVLTVSDQRQIPVKGVSSVEIKIRRQPGSRDTQKVLLENVLHVPGWLCNIISDIYFAPARDFEHNWNDFGVSFKKREDGKWKHWGYTESFCGLDKLVMSRKLEGRSPMLEDKEREIFSVNVTWPQSQRDKWDRLMALEMKMEAEEHEANARRVTKKESHSPLNKMLALKKSLPDIGQFTRDLKSGLTDADANTASVKRTPSGKKGSMRLSSSKSAFREVLPWRKSSEK